MSAFAAKVAAIAHVAEEKLERIAGGGLSQVLRVPRADGRVSVAKGGAAVATEAAMLRALAEAGASVPMVEGEHENVLLLEHIQNDAVFSTRAWGSIGEALRRLHARTAED
jgi:aminoglycoside phosphotransferase